MLARAEPLRRAQSSAQADVAAAPKRILLHDYSGHPFQVQLSRALAARGHTVRHVYFSEFQTPRGLLSLRDGDSRSLAIDGISIGAPFAKQSFLKRRRQEAEYGRRVGHDIVRFRPDVVISSNAPIDAQVGIARATREAGAAFVFWVQDLYGEAIARVLSAKLPLVGGLIGARYKALEASLLRDSDAVIAITADFLPYLERSGVASERISVIENWAPLDEMPLLPRDNDWARANGFVDRTNIAYTGTLGRKHDPSLLLDLARATPAFVSVFSEGQAADALAAEAGASGLDNLAVRPWVPFADLPKVLAAAELAVVLIEPDAGVFSVPSKVLTYMAAARPILAAIPKANLAARLIERENAGVVVAPGDSVAFVAAAERILGSEVMRTEMGRNGRRYAERAFDVGKVAERFEGIAATPVLARSP